jgi:hypothetical protein
MGRGKKDKNGVLSEDTFKIEMEYSRILCLLICMFKIKQFVLIRVGTFLFSHFNGYRHYNLDETLFSKIPCFGRLRKNDLYQVWLKLVQWFPRRRFLKTFSEFLLFCYYLPLGKGVVLHFVHWLCQLWLKLAKWFLRRSRKCNSLTDGQTTNNQKIYPDLSFQLRWAKNHGKRV